MSVKGKVIKIGRADDNHIVCAHETVNKYHAELFVDAEGNVFLTDLSSMNGTYVNGKRVHDPLLLKEGDILKIAQNITIDWTRVLPKKQKVEPVVSESKEEPIKPIKPTFEPEKPNLTKSKKSSFSFKTFLTQNWDVALIYGSIILMIIIIRAYTS